ncbi:MAG: nuclear transport factor 2 family protein, partial [Candidatus Dormibacteraceae bacterium]
MGAAENAALVRRYFEAVHEDPRQTAALYAPEVVLHYVARHALGGAWQGREAIQDLFRRSAQAFGGKQRLDLIDVLASETRAVA